MFLKISSFKTSIASAARAVRNAESSVNSLTSNLPDLAKCDENGRTVLDDLRKESEQALVRLKTSLKGGSEAWGGILRSALKKAGDAAGAAASQTAETLIRRAVADAASTIASRVLSYAERKAYAIAAAVDMVMALPDIITKAAEIESASRARLHLSAFKDAVDQMRGQVSIIENFLNLARGKEKDAAYEGFDFQDALDSLHFAEKFLLSVPPSGASAQSHIESATSQLATGKKGRMSESADVEKLFAILSNKEDAEAFFSLKDVKILDSVRSSIRSQITSPLVTAFKAVVELGSLIGTAAHEYGEAMKWMDRKRSAASLVGVTRRAMTGARNDFFFKRSLDSVQSVIARIETFTSTTYTQQEAISTRIECAAALFEVQVQLKTLVSQTKDALVDPSKPVKPLPKLFQIEGQKSMRRMEVVLRLISASVGKVTVDESGRITTARQLFDDAEKMTDEAMDSLGPPETLPAGWGTFLLLTREAGLKTPVEELLTGGFAGRAVGAYGTISDGIASAKSVKASISALLTKVPCGPKALDPTPALSERVVGLRVARERTEELLSTTSLDAIDASHVVEQSRFFAVNRLTDLLDQAQE